jgi:hypothetical protein
MEETSRACWAHVFSINNAHLHLLPRFSGLVRCAMRARAGAYKTSFTIVEDGSEGGVTLPYAVAFDMHTELERMARKRRVRCAQPTAASAAMLLCFELGRLHETLREGDRIVVMCMDPAVEAELATHERVTVVNPDAVWEADEFWRAQERALLSEQEPWEEVAQVSLLQLAAEDAGQALQGAACAGSTVGAPVRASAPAQELLEVSAGARAGSHALALDKGSADALGPGHAPAPPEALGAGHAPALPEVIGVARAPEEEARDGGPAHQTAAPTRPAEVLGAGNSPAPPEGLGVARAPEQEARDGGSAHQTGAPAHLAENTPPEALRAGDAPVPPETLVVILEARDGGPAHLAAAPARPAEDARPHALGPSHVGTPCERGPGRASPERAPARDAGRVSPAPWPASPRAGTEPAHQAPPNLEALELASLAALAAAEPPAMVISL